MEASIAGARAPGRMMTAVSFAPVAVFVAWLAVVFLWRPSILTLAVDDSYFVLNIARHAARGEGFTFDGLHPTNGFHPLWGVLAVPFAWLFGDSTDAYVRVVLAAQVIAVGWGVYAIAGATGRRNPRMLAACAVPFCTFYFTKIFVNGLESALQFAAIAGVIALVSGRGLRRRLDWIFFGLACATAALSRLTAIVFALMFLAANLRRHPDSSVRWLAPIAFLVPVLGYAAINLGVYGHLLPVNAIVKLHTGDPRLGVVLLAFFAVQTVAALLALTVTRACSLRPALRDAAGALAGYVILQAAADTFIRRRLVSEIWYFVPHATMLLLVIAVLDHERLLARFTKRYAAAWTLVLALGLGVGVLRANPASYAPYQAAREAGEWMRANLPGNAIAAGWDCGIAAAFSDRHVVNLEGLVNSFDFTERYLRPGNVARYLQDEKVDYAVAPFSLALLKRGFTSLNGVEFGDFHVLDARCVHFDPAWRSDNAEGAYVVLGRNLPSSADPQLPTLSEIGPSLARGCSDVDAVEPCFSRSRSGEAGASSRAHTSARAHRRPPNPRAFGHSGMTRRPPRAKLCAP